MCCSVVVGSMDNKQEQITKVDEVKDAVFADDSQISSNFGQA